MKLLVERLPIISCSSEILVRVHSFQHCIFVFIGFICFYSILKMMYIDLLTLSVCLKVLVTELLDK